MQLDYTMLIVYEIGGIEVYLLMKEWYRKKMLPFLMALMETLSWTCLDTIEKTRKVMKGRILI